MSCEGCKVRRRRFRMEPVRNWLIFRITPWLTRIVKGFFRRNVQKGARFICNYEKNCDVTGERRSRAENISFISFVSISLWVSFDSLINFSPCNGEKTAKLAVWLNARAPAWDEIESWSVSIERIDVPKSADGKRPRKPRPKLLLQQLPLLLMTRNLQRKRKWSSKLVRVPRSYP